MYLMLMMHGSTLTQLGEFMAIFFASPLAMGAILATFHIRAVVRERQAFEFLEQMGIPKTQNVIFGVVLYIMLPISLVLFSMLYAHHNNGYSGAIIGIVVWFGGITIKEVIEHIHRKYFNST